MAVVMLVGCNSITGSNNSLTKVRIGVYIDKTEMSPVVLLDKEEFTIAVIPNKTHTYIMIAIPCTLSYVYSYYYASGDYTKSYEGKKYIDEDDETIDR